MECPPSLCFHASAWGPQHPFTGWAQLGHPAQQTGFYNLDFIQESWPFPRGGLFCPDINYWTRTKKDAVEPSSCSSWSTCLALLGTGEGGYPPLLITPHVLRAPPFPGETTGALKDQVASPRKMPEPAILRPLLATAHSYLEPTPWYSLPQTRSRDRPQRKAGSRVRPVCESGGAQRPLYPSLPAEEGLGGPASGL